MSTHLAKIIYINLDKRTGRKREMEEELRSHGLEAERFPAHYNELGIAGCTHSHLDVLKLAKERDYPNVLILEDDFEFLVSKEEFEQELSALFAEAPKFDVCMLSYNLIDSEEIPQTPFRRVLEAQTASGYIVNRHYYDELIQLYERVLPLLIQTVEHWNYANDQAWKPLQRRDQWICFSKRLGKQRAGFSDNAGIYRDFGF
jgi:glycosyl transferase family 25